MEAAFTPPVAIRLSEAALAEDWVATRLRIYNPSSGEPGVGLRYRIFISKEGGEVAHQSPLLPAQEAVEYDFGAAALEEGRYTVRLEFEQEGRLYLDAPSLEFCKQRHRGLFSPFAVASAGGVALEVGEINAVLQMAATSQGEAVERIKIWEQTRRSTTLSVEVERPSALWVECAGAGCGISLSPEEEPRIVTPGGRCCLGVLPEGEAVLGFHSLFSHANAAGEVRLLELVPWEVALPQAPPEVPLLGINDWAEYFAGDSLPQVGQIARIIAGQRELGLGEIAWSAARSWVEYRSRLADASPWPVVPLEEAARRDPRAQNYAGRTAVLNTACVLREAMQQAAKQGVVLAAWVALNTHYYAEALGGICCSRWFQKHPRFHQWRKGAPHAFPGEVCYYFEEVRSERIAIIDELAGLGVERFVLDATRQPRVALYHPEMVAAYREQTGVDPLEIDESHGAVYEGWIRWRSGFFTAFLRELRATLARRHPSLRAHVTMRIPQCGVKLNLASGFDVETWLKEGLIERLCLNPLDIYEGGGLREVAPYVEACHAAGVEVYGGIGQTWAWENAGATAALHRMASLLDAGVDGVDLYESELLARCHPLHPLVPHLRSRSTIATLLEQSNLAACYPLSAENVLLGYDNHSRWAGGGWRMSGFGENSL